jgi:DNA replication protein DnaC
MTLIEIERALKQLRLSGVRATLQTRVLEAQTNNQPFIETFALVLQDELDRRRSSLVERRYRMSGLDERASFNDFDWAFNTKLPRAACFELHTLQFIADGYNALLIGQPGTGKSHLAKAIAYQAILHGHRVSYLESDTVFARYALCSPGTREQLLKNLLDTDLVIIDDLFLAKHIPEAGAEFLQALIHARYKRHGSVVVTSNRVVQDWGAYLGDATMASTILDRLMHRSHLLEFEGRSYRLKEAAARLARRPASA